LTSVRARLADGLVIPAHPLALTARRTLDERRQRALTRYYIDAGAGGVAVGVHTTQFAMHEPRRGLLRPVLELARDTVRDHPSRRAAPLLIAGVIGGRAQARHEATLARTLGYDAVLLGFNGLGATTDDALVIHARAIAEILPVIGFYLQPSVGGRVLGYRFWRDFAEIPGVVAIKIAPFNRYATQVVIRAVADSGREREIALYTGNDDHIVVDLLTRFPAGAGRSIQVVGGLLGHWAFWTRRAVELHRRCHRIVTDRRAIPAQLLQLAAATTDANGAVFDAAHDFRGCIPGIHEILRRQGLLAGTWCLDPAEGFSPGQMAEIDRVCAAYPGLTDDAFVAERIDRWMR
jgi:dihydrodipicolinate synthase/N-acetylneuraminate lyase